MAEGKHYAILRTEKIKTWKHLAEVGKHNNRLIPANTVPGAMPPTELVPGPDDLTERVRARHKQLGVAHEDGKVIAIEVLMTASPEWWASADNWQKKEFIEQSAKSLYDKFGKGVVSISAHTDESTPHLQAVVIPVYQDIVKRRGRKPTTPEGIAKRAAEEAAAPRVWRISYDRILGGSPQVLADYQTEYHSYVKHLGLARGEDTVGEGIKHTTLKDYAKRLKAEGERVAAFKRQLLGEADEVADRSARVERSIDRFKNELQTYRNNVVQANAKKRRLDKREKYLRGREESLASRTKSVNVRDVLSQERFAQAEEKEQQVEAREAQVAARLQDIEERETQLALSTSRLEGRATQLRESEETIDKREATVSVHEMQVAIIADIAVGRRAASWDAGSKRPTIIGGSVDEETKKALDAPWSEKLVQAGITIAKAIARQSRLALLILRLRTKARLARQKEKQQAILEESVRQSETRAAETQRLADRDFAAATDKLAQADRSIAQSKRLKSSADAANSDLYKRKASAEEEIRNLENSIVTAKATYRDAVRDTTEAESKRDAANVDLAVITKDVSSAQASVVTTTREKEGLTREKQELADSLIPLRQEKSSLVADIASIRAERRELAEKKVRLTKSQQQLEKDRVEFDREEAARATGSELLKGVLEDLHSIAATRDAFVLTPTDRTQRARLIEQQEVPDWFGPLVQTITQFHRTIDRAEASEQQFHAARKELLSLYPKKAKEIDAKVPSPASTRQIYDLDASRHDVGGR
ncbi:MAG: plasmid recombination protein [Parerythrobacter sp.]